MSYISTIVLESILNKEPFYKREPITAITESSDQYKGHTPSNSVSPLDGSPYLKTSTKLTQKSDLNKPSHESEPGGDGGMNFKDATGKTIGDNFHKEAGGILSESSIGNKILAYIAENTIVSSSSAMPITGGRTPMLEDEQSNDLPPVYTNEAPAVETAPEELDNINTNTTSNSGFEQDTSELDQTTGPQYYAPDNGSLNPSDDEASEFDDPELVAQSMVNDMINTIGNPDAVNGVNGIEERFKPQCGCGIMESVINLCRK